MLRGRKEPYTQMKRKKGAECCIQGNLFVTDVPVWYESDGKVSPVWLSICEEECIQTTTLGC